MIPTPHFTGSGLSPSHREEAQAVAQRLAGTHRDLGFNFLYSAAAYLLRDGQRPRDGAMIEEAKRRRQHLDDCLERNRRKFAAGEAGEAAA